VSQGKASASLDLDRLAPCGRACSDSTMEEWQGELASYGSCFGSCSPLIFGGLNCCWYSYFGHRPCSSAMLDGKWSQCALMPRWGIRSPCVAGGPLRGRDAQAARQSIVDAHDVCPSGGYRSRYMVESPANPRTVPPHTRLLARGWS